MPDVQRASDLASSDDLLDAVRLALEGAKNDETAIKVIRYIVGDEAMHPERHLSVAVFIDAVRDLGGRLEVLDA